MDWWREIARLKGQRLKTLGRGELFNVVGIKDRAVIIKVLSTGNARPIGRDELESALAELTARGEISLTEIRKNRRSEVNPTYVAAILASLRSVTH